MKKKYTLLLGAMFTISLPVNADNYALIMGISNYPSQPLVGVKKDIETAKLLAQSLNVPDYNMTIKTDNELTLVGMKQTLSDFENKIKKGDQVFIYFSGHGTSYQKEESINEECEQALVSYDTGYFEKKSLLNQITRITHKASKTFMFLDACFSGGLVENEFSDRAFQSNPVQAKFFVKSGMGSCGKASNYTSRDFGIVDASETPNYYLLASSGVSEVSIDGGKNYGGFATTNFYHCLKKDYLHLYISYYPFEITSLYLFDYTLLS